MKKYKDAHFPRTHSLPISPVEWSPEIMDDSNSISTPDFVKAKEQLQMMLFLYLSQTNHEQNSSLCIRELLQQPVGGRYR